MASIDERVVSMAFENAKFEAGVAQTMATLAKLNAELAKVGSVTGFGDIDKAAGKVTLEAPMSALDRLRARLFGVGDGAADGFSEIDKAGNKVSLEAPMSALDRLRARLAGVGTGAADGFADIEKASNKVSLEGLTRAIQGVAGQFSILEGAASVALGNIVTMAGAKGAQIVKSLSLGGAIQGFEEYATNLNSIQTILANTKASGADLQDVNAALAELNEYSDKTIYNFSEMAKNIGTFTAAGVDLERATGSIKGIANLAALSGSNSQQASTAMYQLSQAISAGRVSLQDWNSVVNAGMGGTVFQRALAQTAENMGTLNKGAVELKGKMKNVTVEGQSFRESIMAAPGKESWLTSDVLTKTLEQFTGDLTDAQLAAEGFSAEQIKAIQAQAKTATAAATEVKTLKQVFDVAQETIGSGWSRTFQTIFGDFEEAKKTFTDLSNAINEVINAGSDARNKLLGDWKELGGRTDLIEGIKNIFEAFASVIKPIRDAFRQVFPPATGKDLAELTERFRNFTETLKIGPETADALRRTFAGLFALLHIGVSIVKNVFRVIGDLLGVVGKGSGGFLNFTGSIGDFLVALDKALTKGGALTGLFDGLASVIKVPLQLLGLLSSAIFGLFSGDNSDNAEKFAGGLAKITETAGPLRGAIEFLVDAWEKLVDVLGRIREAVEPWLTNVATAFSNFGDIVAEQFNNINWDNAFGAIQTGLIAGLFLAIRKAIKGGVGIDLGGGMLESLNETFQALTGNLQAMQKNIQAGTLLKIASAIGILAAAVTALSMVEPDPLRRAMTAIAIGMGQLIAALALLAKVAKGGAFLTLPFIAASLIGLSTAVLILAGAVKIFSTMDWEELAKGLVGVGGALAAVGVGVKLIGPGAIPAAVAIIPLAIALNILALAVKQFAELELVELAKGIGAVGVALATIGVAMGLMPPTMLLTGAGLIAVGIGLNAVAAAVGIFGNMPLETMYKGLLGISAALVAIGISVGLIPPTLALQAAGLVILGAALASIAGSIALMGKLKIGTLVKGITALAGVLGVLAVGLTLMAGTLPGSAALLAAAGAFMVLAPAIALLGNLEWSTIFKGLAAIALALGTLAVAGLLVAPALLALGVAMVPLGIGFAAVGAAAYLFAKAIAVVGADGTKAVATVIAALTALGIALPKIVVTFLKGLVDIAGEVAKIAPKVLMALGIMIDQIIAFVIESAPDLAVAIGVLIQQFAIVVGQNAPVIIAAGFKLLVDFLSGVSANLPLVLAQVVDIVTKFLEGLAKEAPRLVKGGIGALQEFLKGITANFPNLVKTVANMITVFLNSVASHIPKVIRSAVNMVAKFIGGVASQINKVIQAGVDLIIAVLKGIGDAIPRLVKAGLQVARKFLFGIADGVSELADIGFKAVIRFLNGIERAIRENDRELFRAGAQILDAIVDGVVEQAGAMAGPIKRAIEGLFGLLPGWAKDILGISSPSKVFAEIGANTMQGFIVGIKDADTDVASTMRNSARNIVASAQETLGKVPNLLDGIMDLDPTITPVLDLTAVEKEAKKLGGLTATTPIVATVSADTASAISSEKSAADVAQVEAAASAAPVISLEQNNYSPEALSEIEIYRQTNNQLAQLKSAVGLLP